MYFQLPLIMFFMGMKASNEAFLTKYVNAFQPQQPAAPCKSNLTS